MADPRGQRRSPFGPLVIVGVAVIVVSCVVLLGEAGTSYIESPWTIVFVLAGIAVALWQPRHPGVRRRSAVGVAPAPPAPPPPSVTAAPIGARSLDVGAGACSSAQPGRSATRSPATACTRNDGSAPPQRSAAWGWSSVRGGAGRCGSWCRACCSPVRGSSPVTRPAPRSTSSTPGRGISGSTRRRALGLPEEEHLIAGEIEVTLFSAPADGTRAPTCGSASA